MELYIKNNVSDITYPSELILDTKATITKNEPYVSRINSHSTQHLFAGTKVQFK